MEKNGKKWIEIKELGQLYIEKILLALDVPIFFVCTDCEANSYLCLCIDVEIGQYVIAEVKHEQLLKLLCNEVPMETVFRNCKNRVVYITEYNFNDNCMMSNIVDVTDLSEDLLPDKGEYFEVNNEEIDEYITYLKSKYVKITAEDYYNYYYRDIIGDNILSKSVYEAKVINTCSINRSVNLFKINKTYPIKTISVA